MSKPTVSFDGYDLASNVAGLIVVATDPYRGANRNLNVASLANTDRSVTSAAYFTDKKINVHLEIGRDTRELFDAALDQLYTILQTREAALIFSYGSTTRKWTATFSNIQIDEVKGGHAVITLEFQCSNPSGYDTASTTIVTSSRSGRTSTDTPFVVGGTFKYQTPIITITLTNVTGGTGAMVSVGNPASGQQVDVTRNWASNDVLVIDSQAKTVKVNGVAVDFDGAIPEWTPGSGSMSYADNLTTGIHAHSVIYYKRYL